VDIWLVSSVLLLELWIMLNICQLLNWTTQLDNSSLAQAMLHFVQCVCEKSISDYRKHTSAEHPFWSQILLLLMLIQFSSITTCSLLMNEVWFSFTEDWDYSAQSHGVSAVISIIFILNAILNHTSPLMWCLGVCKLD